MQGRSGVDLTICARFLSGVRVNGFTLILPRLTRVLPGERVECWARKEGLELVDPDYLTSGETDMILGAEMFKEIAIKGMLHRPSRAPIAQRIKLGWILGSGVMIGCFRNPSLYSLIVPFFQIRLSLSINGTNDTNRLQDLTSSF